MILVARHPWLAGRAHVLPNGFDRAETPEDVLLGAGFWLVHTGRLYGREQQVRCVSHGSCGTAAGRQGAVRRRRREPGAPDADRLDLGERVRVEPLVPLPRALGYQRAADGLLLVNGRRPESDVEQGVRVPAGRAAGLRDLAVRLRRPGALRGGRRRHLRVARRPMADTRSPPSCGRRATERTARRPGGPWALRAGPPHRRAGGTTRRPRRRAACGLRSAGRLRQRQLGALVGWGNERQPPDDQRPPARPDVASPAPTPRSLAAGAALTVLFAAPLTRRPLEGLALLVVLASTALVLLNRERLARVGRRAARGRERRAAAYGGASRPVLRDPRSSPGVPVPHRPRPGRRTGGDVSRRAACAACPSPRRTWPCRSSCGSRGSSSGSPGLRTRQAPSTTWPSSSR